MPSKVRHFLYFSGTPFWFSAIGLAGVRVEMQAVLAEVLAPLVPITVFCAVGATVVCSEITWVFFSAPFSYFLLTVTVFLPLWPAVVVCLPLSNSLEYSTFVV